MEDQYLRELLECIIKYSLQQIYQGLEFYFPLNLLKK